VSAVLVGLVSAKGSPGVTTSALALASQWPRTALLVDADPFGGDVRAGLGGGDWPPAAGLAELVVDLRSTTLEQALYRRVHQLAPYAPPVLAGLGCVGQSASVPWSRLGPLLARIDGADVVADCGRFAAADGVIPLLRTCDALVLVTASSLRAVRSAARIAPLLQEATGAEAGDPRVSLLVVVADEPYSAAEIADGCRLPLLGEMPKDAMAAAVWSDGARPGRSFARCAMQRAARQIAEKLASLGPSGRPI
jgi:MinD-like ATPase involved in chromosome partitioning or flagellar assembly